ncbi:peptide-methionine (S)-S-oxide reductase [Formivibrio citricus]|uniref:Peptide methionine sulfoxide reductase MsrA n=1 Tax=Formivibrio citricus TaxID=83765 RepID=A0A1I4Y355_9NEIS|nr:peptide-methionine (S)-S-oxide reductase MsrA [Formivibrio citricus]SFN32514.1 peptide-methionine (S)-S-oxide reductase [Formivibrio citricus]
MSELATLAGGCFWCLEAAFQRLSGVESVQSGYTGGHIDAPSYRQVCTGDTGHAEAVQIRFDPDVISYGQLLDVFFAIHDPTTLNRQGHDIGSQYRSAIFFHNQKQETIAHRKIEEIARLWPDPVVTEVVPATTFWPAEDYHSDYFRQNQQQPYCELVIAPKIAKLLKDFTDLVHR